jgi:hypothetical protein
MAASTRAPSAPIPGVAKKVSLHAVRVVDCAGYGMLSNAIAGVDDVTEDHSGPTVANLSRQRATRSRNIPDCRADREAVGAL